MKEHVIGECFNPWRQACGFYAPDIVGKQRTLVDDKGKSRTITDGQKRLGAATLERRPSIHKCNRLGLFDLPSTMA
jgi:hypothetical protein